MREIFDGWLELAKDARSFLVLDDLHCIAKTEVEVSPVLLASKHLTHRATVVYSKEITPISGQWPNLSSIPSRHSLKPARKCS